MTINLEAFLTRKQVAAILGLSYDTVADRAGGTECLMEIRQTKKVQFNSEQVAMHHEAVRVFGRCDGRCKAALQPKRLKLAS